MNVRASILFYLCLTTSVFITWKALGLAGDLAFNGKQPMIWVNLLAFAVAILLVFVAVLIRAKYTTKK